MAQRRVSGKDRIIFPVDVPSLKQAGSLVDRLRDHVGLFKIGLTFFVVEGVEGLRKIQEIAGGRIFLDLKFNDIPQTVADACSALAASGVAIQFLTVHAGGGPGAVRAAVKAVGPGVQVLGVTVLTSLSPEDLAVTGGLESIPDRVITLAKITQSAGGAGVVCSSQEVRSVKAEMGKRFVVVTPGIRPVWAAVAGDDQRRIMTPREAILHGADYLVVGRPIARASNPLEAARKIAEEIDDALENLPRDPIG